MTEDVEEEPSDELVVLSAGAVAGFGLPLVSYWLAAPGQPLGVLALFGCLIVGGCLTVLPGLHRWLGMGLLLGGAGLAVAFMAWLSASGLELS